jgi:hypothetical protein
MSDTEKKTRGRPRTHFEIPEESKNDETFMLMYRTWCAQKKAKQAYYARHRERILKEIKTKKKEIDDLNATQVAMKN